ncbi:MAG TPA: SDR family NAD(P)-dependent oxidoreductase, partial [Vicinamibacteria bacterium]|nr:SDR family NAD(P)-dependent oxidoreductase [Vicinamibacteria bacterium]
MGARDAARGEAARRDVAESTGSRTVELAVFDQSIQAQVRAFTGRFARENERLDVLVNNAGTWLARREETSEGVERTWATNVLGYFLVTEGLRPLLARSAPARIVNVASELAHDLDLSDVEFRRRPYEGVAAYAQSKQANRMWTWALARRLEGTGVGANAMHPGGVNTPLFRKGGSWKGLAGAVYGRVMGKSPEEGADTIVHLATSPEVEGASGRFWVDRSERTCRFRGEPGEEALWALCENMTAARHG